MKDGYFDAVARLLGGEESRRGMVRLLAGSALGFFAAHWDGLSETEAGGKGKGGKRKKKRKRKKRCDDFVVPLCTGCEEARCNSGTGKWVCQSTCGEAEECCNGSCRPACFNYCDRDPAQACLCKKPRGPQGVYCAVSDLCGDDPCEPDEEYDSRTCTCKPRTCTPACDPSAEEKCCDGECVPCPALGVCNNDGSCTCSGERPIFCPPSPIAPISGYCCKATEAGYPFAECSWVDKVSGEVKHGCSYHF